MVCCSFCNTFRSCSARLQAHNNEKLLVQMVEWRRGAGQRPQQAGSQAGEWWCTHGWGLWGPCRGRWSSNALGKAYCAIQIRLSLPQCTPFSPSMPACLQILDEVADPGSCEIVQFKGPFAFELNPKMPKPPPRQRSPTGEHLNPFSNEFIAPEDPTERPLIARCAGNTGASCAVPQLQLHLQLLHPYFT